MVPPVLHAVVHPPATLPTTQEVQQLDPETRARVLAAAPDFSP